MVDWYIGTMGFSYKQWVGPFYPDGLAGRLHLSYYAERFNALEMDSTFYGTPSEAAVQRWASVTPEEFKICPKMPRQITHEARLVEAEELTDEFLGRMALLGEKLGPILLQFPPDFSMAELSALIPFLRRLPADFRYAVEFRHKSWNRRETAVLLETHEVCWAGIDYIYMPHQVVTTTDFIYLRFLGQRGRFPGKDRELLDRTADLEKWWRLLQPHLEKATVAYAFFNDDYAGFAPQTSNRFKKVVGVEAGEIRPLQQGRLF
jgi:uncharacterized protein YecE (DUF72 family)